MEPEENCGNANLKRQREPLSDSEDNFLLATEVNDGQKRRRLEASGQENRSPKPSSSGRLAELETKPDTPIVPSVRSRVQLLTQRRDGASVAQRCFSDPGAEGSSITAHDRGVREHLLSEGEFNQRMKRFKAPQASLTLTQSPSNSCPPTRSGFVSDIQHKLQCTTTPSSKQASLIRQEREQELNQLRLQPISENAWLKRSSSDSSLTQQARTPAGPSSPSTWVPRSKRSVCWPPMQTWDVRGDAEMKDGSFFETTSDAQKPSVIMMGESTPSASAQLQSFQEGDAGEEVGEQKDHLGSDQPENQTILKLSFSEDQNVSELPVAATQRCFQTTGRSDVSKGSGQSVPEVFTFDEDEILEDSSYGEEEMEASTDEELKMWRYPKGMLCKDEKSVRAKGHETCPNEELESSRVDDEPADIQDGGFRPPADVSAEFSGCPDKQEHERTRPEEEQRESESCLGDSGREKSAFDSDQCKTESKGRYEDRLLNINISTATQEQRRVDGCPDEYDALERSDNCQTAGVKDVAKALKETQTSSSDHEMNIKAAAQLSETVQDAASDSYMKDDAQSSGEITAAEAQEMDRDPVRIRHFHEQADGRESSKKVTFILQPELINSSPFSVIDTSLESRAETSLSDAGSSSHDETNAAELIEQMFEEVLEYAEKVEEKRRNEGADCDTGIGACSGGSDKTDEEGEKEKNDEAEAREEECDQDTKLDSSGDELLTFPPSGILSPLSKSVEAVVTPLRLAATQESNPPSWLQTPEDSSAPPAESAPLYSIDAYRTQRLRTPASIQSVTPAVQRRAAETSQPHPPTSTKEKVMALTEEAGKLQTVISQTLQALSCCTDEEHGRGSLEEAEAEKLLLVSCEKRSALLAEVARLREERNSEEVGKEDREHVSHQPCRGTFSITNIQLPLKVEFVCSSHSRTGRPSHYFFVLIRYGPCNMVATPLATAADAENGDTISFPTSVTLKDIRSSFEIDVEVYSLSQTSGSSCSTDRTTTKSRVTPRKLLNTITRASNSLTCSAPNTISTRRSSNFCLVGSHKITLASLGLSKFPLDKMKFEGKIRKLLGDEFQEKVPFLSPLEGSIYLQLDSESHSNVQHQGFLTMFELISGYGVWHRRYFLLEGCNMTYWNHPNDRETKEAEGSISLSRSPSQCVRPVKRDSCARPFTFELVSSITEQPDSLSKCWFSADTNQERLDWMEKLSQALLDLHTWKQSQSGKVQPGTSSVGSLRESLL
ncbi:anillin isoform X3 [Melanotaenia boesemani]|uniref:anillin isoform X3 n=1 Tax=Melanotaenia boesemani TaxID=1250792 RepID=UPI001C05550C|nr:anillin isoform X3 [Melanotaenia boesemani]